MHPAVTHLIDAALDACAFSDLERCAHEAATGRNSRPEPTAAQTQAGNYKMGHAKVHGMPLRIENVRGSVRRGVGADGKPWESRMAAHYGYIAGTRGADGDGIDVFVGPFPESTRVWVINQRNPGGGFDEHKVMLGFWNEAQAKSAYLNSYDRDWKGLMSIVPASITQLRWWIKNGNKRVAMSSDQLPHEGIPVMDQVLWNKDAQPQGRTMAQLIYGLRTEDAGQGLLVDSVTMDEVMDDPDIEERLAMDALVVEVGRLQPKMQQLLTVMKAAGDAVKPVDFTISDPVRMRGTLQIAVLFAMDDGQSITVWFHNPDTTPNKLTPMDELISWKWMLNKRDVTIVVAPERGRDLNIREVARRVMRLVDKNSAMFAKANAKAGERAAQLKALDDEIATLTTELNGWMAKIDEARIERDNQQAETSTKIRELQGRLNKLTEAAERAKQKPEIGDLYGTGLSLMAILNEIDDLADEIRTLRGEPVQGRTSWDQWQALRAAEAAREADAAYLPEGWSEASAGGMATNGDPVRGGIVDYNAQLGKWFVVANQSGIDTKDQWFDTRRQAFEHLEALVAASIPAKDEPALVQVEPIGDFGNDAEGTAKLREVARAAYEAMLGSMVPCPALGADVELRKRGMRKVLSMSADARKLKVMASIKDIITQGRKIGTRPPYNGDVDKSAVAYHTLKTVVRLDQEDLAVRVVIKEDNNGNFHYDHTVHAAEAVLDAVKANGSTEVDPSTAAASNGGGTDPSRFVSDQRDVTVDQASSVVKNALDGVRAGQSNGAATGGNLGCTSGRSAKPEPASLHPSEPSEGHRSGSTLDDAGAGVNVGEVFNLFIEGEPAELVVEEQAPAIDNRTPTERHAQELADILLSQGFGAYNEARSKVAADLGMDANAELDLGRLVEGLVGPARMTLERAKFDPEGQGVKAWHRGESPIPPEGLSDEQRAQWLAGWDAAKQNADEANPAKATAADVDEVLINLGFESKGAFYWVKKIEGAPGLFGASYSGGWLELTARGDRLTDFAVEGMITVQELKDKIKQAIDGYLVPDEEVDDPATPFVPFDASAIKMPTAAQMGFNIRGKVRVWEPEPGQVAPGWTNGIILDVASRPKVVEAGIAKYSVDLNGLGRIDAGRVERVVSGVRSNAIEVTPIAFDTSETVTYSTKGETRTPSDAVILADEDQADMAAINRYALGYFSKTYRGAQFFIDKAPNSFVLVKHRGAVVGVIAPINYKDKSATLGHVRRALTRAQIEAADPIKIVDRAYNFERATDRFKSYIAETVGETDYSMFATAKDIDQAAKAEGAEVSWDVEGVALDGVGHAVNSLAVSLETLVTNEPINRANGNVEQADLEADAAADIREAIEILQANEATTLFDEPEPVAVLDAAGPSTAVVGRISKGGVLAGRAVILGDGKAMIFTGESGTERVTLNVEGDIRPAWWTQSGADLVKWLFNPPAAAPDPAEEEGPAVAWRVTNSRGYSAVHQAATEVRAIQAGMAEVDYTLPSSEWRAVREDAGAIPEVTGLDLGNANIMLLREIVDGKHDADATGTLELGTMLRSIEDSMKALVQLNGSLSDAEDALVQQAITHWAELDEKVNG